MQLLVPDSVPPSPRDRAKAALVGAVLTAAALFLFWYAPQAADPNWKASSPRLSHMDDWSPFWRGAHHAILGSWLAPLALVAFWKAVRPFTPHRAK